MIFRYVPKSIKSTMKSTMWKNLGDFCQSWTTSNDHLTQNVKFRAPFRISRGAKMNPGISHFRQKRHPQTWVTSGGSVLEPTLLFLRLAHFLLWQFPPPTVNNRIGLTNSKWGDLKKKNLVRHSHNFLLPYIMLEEYFINSLTFIFNFYCICFVVDELFAFIIIVYNFLT